MSATLSLSSSTYRPSLLAPHHRASYPCPAVPVSGYPRASQGRSMQDPASELRRIPLPRTLVNKARRRTGLIWAPALPLAQITHLVVDDATFDGADLVPVESTANTL